MYYDHDKRTITTKKKAIYRKIEYSPEMLLYITYSRLDRDRYPFFSGKWEYYTAYLEGKRDNRDLGRAIKTKLVEENIRLERELETMRGFREQYQAYRAIRDVLKKHHIYGWRSDIAAELDKVLTRKCPGDISSIRSSLEGIVNRLERMEETEE